MSATFFTRAYNKAAFGYMSVTHTDPYYCQIACLFFHMTSYQINHKRALTPGCSTTLTAYLSPVVGTYSSRKGL